MNPSGYSGKPLVEKLGYKPGQQLLAINEPVAFKAYLQDNGLLIVTEPTCDWVHVFFTELSDLQRWITTLNKLTIRYGIWVSWPKKASGVVSYITEQDFRDTLLPLGWVDTKVCSIDDTWSGLKFLRRKV